MTRAMADVDLREEIAAERRELADVLSGLSGQSWDSSTLCAGWRVREVVAHMTIGDRSPIGLRDDQGGGDQRSRDRLTVFLTRRGRTPHPITPAGFGGDAI